MKTIDLTVILLCLLVSAPLFADSTDTKESSETVTVVEEELSLEEELELIGSDLLVTEDVKKDSSSAEDSVETAIGDTTVTDTTEIKRSGPSSGTSSITSTTGHKKRGSDSTAVADSVEPEEEYSLSDIEIDNAGSVDLDKNVKEYRSPRRAMLYSLAVPGWGQAYTKKTWKSVLFGALEVGFIVGAVKFNKDGEDKQKEAHALADAGFSLDHLSSQYGVLQQRFVSEANNLGAADADAALMEFITGGTSNSINEFITNMQASSDAFYDRDHGVGSYGAILGWRDNINVGDTLFRVFFTDDNSAITINSVEVGGSAMQLQYNDMLRKADDYAKYKQVFIVGIFTNHVASAIDAFITARRYNRKLLAMQNKTAYRKRIIDNIHIDNDLAFDVRKGVVTKVGFKWNF